MPHLPGNLGLDMEEPFFPSFFFFSSLNCRIWTRPLPDPPRDEEPPSPHTTFSPWDTCLFFFELDFPLFISGFPRESKEEVSLFLDQVKIKKRELGRLLHLQFF